jgi:hypothetical protein
MRPTPTKPIRSIDAAIPSPFTTFIDNLQKPEGLKPHENETEEKG